MARSQEIEFKFKVSGEEDFLALARALGSDGPLPSPVYQTNHFFDTAAHTLREAGVSLRLRDEEGHFTLTAKGSSHESGELTRRTELAVEVDASTARAILEQTESPLELLGAEHPASSLLEAARCAREDRPLIHVGLFENARRRLGPVSLAGSSIDEPLVFELDRTTFPGRTDFEIEVELAQDEHVEAAGAALRALFAEAGIVWSTAESKAKRFFSLADGTHRNG